MATEAVNGVPSDAAPPVTGAEKKKTTSPAPEKSSELNGEPSNGNAGEKRGHDGEVAAEENAADTTSEPVAKKQKTNAKASKTDKGAKPQAAANGDKKRGPGRPKKGDGQATARKTQKAPKPRSTEGIGSRTRSRATA